ncbi:fatty-acid peroxygenase [Sporosarcina sp. NCCP-2716]|uniref:cytochrome P450 n=1 Tax=Sporosarcina sp. NCCP-2716 TaxID=2943679 RepID=UPI00203E7296|nr:cytochrome P450 [Sporosarcina sp. NCCP-2716]GKV68527.1 fatty-acid peroxygenase [Sporosarcina sp. NCCP-2716]
MTNIPKEEGLDHTISVLKEGYDFIPNRSRQFNSNLFETSLLGERVICMTGEEAGEIFYDNNKFIRSGAAPKHAQKTLLGEKGVQSLDGEAHHHRKAMFMELMNPEHIRQLGKLIADEWERKLDGWGDGETIRLYQVAQEVLTRAAVRWAGVPLEEKDVEKRTRQLAQLFESPASVGMKYRGAVHARKELEKWIAGLVEDVRQNKLQPPSGTALLTFSEHKDLEGKLLEPRIAAVEVLNIVRPIVAISIYIAFTGHALLQHPDERAALEGSKEEPLEHFVQEVRRLYPFFPFNGARVKDDFEWKGMTFEKGTLVLFDFYGTSREEKNWPDPDQFRPGRFASASVTPFNFVPQGGGDYATGHRCAGEWATIEVMKVTLDYLANKMAYDIPEQDMGYSKASMPAVPESEIIMENVRRR